MFIVLLFPFLFSWHYSPCAADIVSLSPSRVSQSTIKVSVLWFPMRTHSKALEWVKQAWQYLGVLSRPYCSQIKHRRVIPFSCNFESNNIDVIIYGMGSLWKCAQERYNAICSEHSSAGIQPSTSFHYSSLRDLSPLRCLLPSIIELSVRHPNLVISPS